MNDSHPFAPGNDRMAQSSGGRRFSKPTGRSVAVADGAVRLPMPQGIEDLTERKWKVLVESIFPYARTPESVVMALDYCHARGLDVFKAPVNIVPMWNSMLRREVETVWPGINEVQTTAARSNAWAGMDKPEWGEMVSRVFRGRRKKGDSWEEAEVGLEFPEWCSVTVYRVVQGEAYAFTEPVYWLEAYGTSGGSELPNAMWAKRPRGQLHKVAKAAALRAAFPEEASLTAEEMEGKEIDPEALANAPVVEARPVNPQRSTVMPPTEPVDTSDIPEQGPEFFEKAAVKLPPHDPETGEVTEPDRGKTYSPETGAKKPFVPEDFLKQMKKEFAQMEAEDLEPGGKWDVMLAIIDRFSPKLTKGEIDEAQGYAMAASKRLKRPPKE